MRRSVQREVGRERRDSVKKGGIIVEEILVFRIVVEEFFHHSLHGFLSLQSSDALLSVGLELDEEGGDADDDQGHQSLGDGEDPIVGLQSQQLDDGEEVEGEEGHEGAFEQDFDSLRADGMDFL